MTMWPWDHVIVDKEIDWRIVFQPLKIGNTYHTELAVSIYVKYLCITKL